MAQTIKPKAKRKPKKRRPAHLKALELPYEVFLEANGGIECCGICGRTPSKRRKLDRDHEHKGNGRPRGLLCVRCNKHLPHFIDVAWLEAALRYLDRPS